MSRALKIVGAIVGVLVVVVVGLVAWVQATYEIDFSHVQAPLIVASADPAVVARGEYLVHAVAHCSACHGPPDAAAQRKLGADPKDLRGGFQMKAGPFGTFYPANLTSDAATGLGQVDDGKVARAIRSGVDRHGRFAAFMRIGVGPISDEDLTAVVSYLRSLPPVPNAVQADEWGFIAKALAGKFQPRQGTPPAHVPEGGISVERGAYLANGPAVCAACHTPSDPMQGFALTGALFSGGAEADPDPTDPASEIVPPNLTSHATGVLKNFTEDAFLARFRAGPAFAGSKMPWLNFGKMTDDDVRSIYRYLQSVPPADHDVGPSRRAKGWTAPGA